MREEVYWYTSAAISRACRFSRVIAYDLYSRDVFHAAQRKRCLFGATFQEPPRHFVYFRAHTCVAIRLCTAELYSAIARRRRYYRPPTSPLLTCKFLRLLFRHTRHTRSRAARHRCCCHDAAIEIFAITLPKRAMTFHCCRYYASNFLFARHTAATPHGHSRFYFSSPFAARRHRLRISALMPSRPCCLRWYFSRQRR